MPKPNAGVPTASQFEALLSTMRTKQGKRVEALLAIGRFYFQAVIATFAYAAFGIQWVHTITHNPRIHAIYDVIGIAIVLLVFATGVFLIRISGYCLKSHVMDEKAIVRLAREFAVATDTWPAMALMPGHPDRVRIPSGTTRFLYLLTAVNGMLPFIALAFVWDWANDMSVSVFVVSTVVLIVGSLYPQVCMRFNRDTQIAKEFAPTFNDHTNSFGRDEKELAHCYDRYRRMTRSYRRQWTLIEVVTYGAAVVGATYMGDAWIATPTFEAGLAYSGFVGIAMAIRIVLLATQERFIEWRRLSAARRRGTLKGGSGKSGSHDPAVTVLRKRLPPV